MIAGQDPFGAFVSLEERADRAASGGPLAGLSYALKDLATVDGRAPTCGLAQPPYPAAASTAPVISMLDAAGARRAGFAEMTPLAYEASGGNPYRKRPVNPWDARRICGGSSSGSAVAVSAGMVDFALGTDTAGSLRIPAHCCGVAAWKPGSGLIDPTGTVPLAPTLDTLGFIARSPALLVRLAKAVLPAANFRSPARLAVARDCLLPAAAKHAVASVERDLAMLGVSILDTGLAALLEACDEPLFTVLDSEASSVHAPLWKEGRLDPGLSRRLARGAEIPADRVAAARATLHRLAGEPLDAAFAGADALLLPVLSIDTPLVEACEPGQPQFSGRTLYALSRYTRFVNGLGLPAVAFPAGFDDHGMPVAVQLVGRPGSDAMLLALAAGLEIGWRPGRYTPPALGISPGERP